MRSSTTHSYDGITRPSVIFCRENLFGSVSCDGERVWGNIGSHTLSGTPYAIKYTPKPGKENVGVDDDVKQSVYQVITVATGGVQILGPLDWTENFIISKGDETFYLKKGDNRALVSPRGSTTPTAHQQHEKQSQIDSSSRKVAFCRVDRNWHIQCDSEWVSGEHSTFMINGPVDDVKYIPRPGEDSDSEPSKELIEKVRGVIDAGKGSQVLAPYMDEEWHWLEGMSSTEYAMWLAPYRSSETSTSGDRPCAFQGSDQMRDNTKKTFSHNELVEYYSLGGDAAMTSAGSSGDKSSNGVSIGEDDRLFISLVF